uniref:Uncharacterized protein n=1 Tax=Lotus japonicus TaxID=34305 RepID=I3T693_LOTJA|nr:unknown [Lotus japonicus]
MLRSFPDSPHIVHISSNDWMCNSLYWARKFSPQHGTDIAICCASS